MRKKRRIKKIILILSWCLVVSSVTACNKENFDSSDDSISNENITSDDMWLPTADNENEKILYDYYNGRFVSYDMEKKQVVEENAIDSYFQYAFNVKSNIYTSGHSLAGQYKIIELSDNKLTELYVMDEDVKKIYPCAADADRGLYYFIEYFDAEETQRKIVQYKDGELYEFVNTEGFLMPGMLIGDNLYYTIWDESKVAYDVYSLDTHDYNSEPVLCMENIDNCDLFYCNSTIYAMSNSCLYNIGNEEETYEKAAYNFFDDENDILIQISTINSYELGFSVTYLSTGERVDVTSGEIISYEITEDVITIYCSEEIVNYTIKEDTSE